MLTVDAVRSLVRSRFETIVHDLTDLVAIPSVSAATHDQSQVARSAEHVAELLRAAPRMNQDTARALLEQVRAADAVGR